MDYEELYTSLSPLEKSLKDAVNAATKQQKIIAKSTETGSLTELKKGLEQLDDAIRSLSEAKGLVQEAVESFDTGAYFMSGDFTRQLLAACEELEIDVRGEKGVYEMFPYKVRIYAQEDHAQEVWIDRKKYAGCRPSALAAHIKSGQEKLYRAKFNEQSFMAELAAAYDITCAVTGTRPGSNLLLNKLYNTLTPMARARKEYDKQAFAFDLARLYELGQDAWVTKAGRRFVFGTSRDGKSGIRVLSSAGVETFICTLRPLAAEE